MVHDDRLSVDTTSLVNFANGEFNPGILRLSEERRRTRRRKKGADGQHAIPGGHRGGARRQCGWGRQRRPSGAGDEKAAENSSRGDREYSRTTMRVSISLRHVPKNTCRLARQRRGAANCPRVKHHVDAEDDEGKPYEGEPYPPLRWHCFEQNERSDEELQDRG